MSTVAHFSLAHYEHMVEVGSFSGPFHKRVELIRGEIIEMTPIGSQHAEFVNRLNEWSQQATSGHPIRIRIQDPIRIPILNSEPEPDIAWVAQKDYSDRHPQPNEIWLLIEVADSSLEIDRLEKLSVYAEAGIAEYWIVNLLDRQIEVHCDPSGKEYRSSTIHRGQEVVSPLVVASARLLPSQLFDG